MAAIGRDPIFIDRGRRRAGRRRRQSLRRLDVLVKPLILGHAHLAVLMPARAGNGDVGAATGAEVELARRRPADAGCRHA
jgi:hypothetical protein